MPIEIIVPRLGWSMEEGAFVAWLKRDGELVKAGDLLFSIEGDKAIQEIESIDSGILRIAAGGPKPGDAIRVGDLLGHLYPETTVTAPTTVVAPAKPVVAVSHSPEVTKAKSPAEVIGVESARSDVPSVAAGPTISPRALRVARELGVDWTNVTGTGRTGRIRERDIRAAVTPSTASGVAPVTSAPGQTKP